MFNKHVLQFNLLNADNKLSCIIVEHLYLTILHHMTCSRSQCEQAASFWCLGCSQSFCTACISTTHHKDELPPAAGNLSCSQQRNWLPIIDWRSELTPTPIKIVFCRVCEQYERLSNFDIHSRGKRHRNAFRRVSVDNNTQ